MTDDSDRSGHDEKRRTDEQTSAESTGVTGRVDQSRRSLLAGAGLLVGAGVVGSVVADSSEQQAIQQVDPESFDESETDVDVLKYALTLERLEEELYAVGLDTYSAEELTAATEFADSDQLGELVPGYITTVSEHEASHAEQLEAVLDVLGAEIPEPPEVSFGLESAEEFVATARIVENTGVAAYAGVAPRIESPDILSFALSIHSVEARHAATLNGLTGESPFPNAYDSALSVPEVLEAVDPFIVEPPPGTPTETPGNETVTGTPGNETITGTPGNETITGTPGNETDGTPPTEPGNESEGEGEGG